MPAGRVLAGASLPRRQALSPSVDPHDPQLASHQREGSQSIQTSPSISNPDFLPFNRHNLKNTQPCVLS